MKNLARGSVFFALLALIGFLFYFQPTVIAEDTFSIANDSKGNIQQTVAEFTKGNSTETIKETTSAENTTNELGEIENLIEAAISSSGSKL